MLDLKDWPIAGKSVMEYFKDLQSFYALSGLKMIQAFTKDAK